MNKKYRPYLTLPQLQLLKDSLSPADSVETSQTYAALALFIEQISLGLRKESIITASCKPKKLQTRSLESLMILFSDSAYAGMTLEEIELLTNHRFNSDLMSPEEEAEYTAKLMQGN